VQCQEFILLLESLARRWEGNGFSLIVSCSANPLANPRRTKIIPLENGSLPKDQKGFIELLKTKEIE
jgi:hypothetical protein